MNDLLKKAMALAIGTQCAEGREVFETPTEHRREGPCPRCGAPVETGPVTFGTTMSSAGLTHLLPKPDEHPARGLIVCHACLTPLMFTQHSAFEVVPKKVLKRLPGVSRRFITRHQELYRAMKKGMN